MKLFSDNKEEYLESGLEFRIEIPKIKIEQFAMIILTLTNMRSSGDSNYSVYDFRTFAGCNTISVAFKTDDKEHAEKVLSYVMESNTLDLDYKIEFSNEIEIISIWLDVLDEEGIIQSPFDTYVKGVY